MDGLISLHTGSAAERRLADTEYLLQWERLAARCPWATVFQRPAFATAWFETYAPRYEPVIVEERDENGTLSGLLSMGKYRFDRKQLVFAGAHQAEYQAWLCMPGQEKGFLLGALRAIDQALGPQLLVFRYLPVRFPVEALHGDPALEHRIFVRPMPRPFIVMADTKPSDTKNLKRKLGILKRLGEVKFERIADAARFDSIMSETIPHHDLRHGAVHARMPFQEDSLKAPFHRRLFDRGQVLHVTALTAGERPVSVHLNTHDAERVHLGICSYSPYVANASPGWAHLALLAPMLAAEGFQQFDLTPGGEPYKERFANAHDLVHELHVYPSRVRWEGARIEAGLRKVTRSVLTRLGYDGTRLRHLLESRGAEPGSTAITSDERDEYLVYSWDGERGARGECRWRLVQDGVQTLLDFSSSLPEQRRRSVLSDALARLATSERLWVFDDGSGTRCWAWFQPTPSAEAAGWGGRALTLPPGTGCVYDLGAISQSQPANPPPELLRALLYECMGTSGIESVRLLVPDGSPWMDAADALGLARLQKVVGPRRGEKTHSLRDSSA
jgi:CelD/BcsL family acetyltransferase involved in cellulose biosynthesis